MTFKHKLSSRLALLKDRVVLASLAGLVTAAIVACELPVRATDPGSTIADLLVSPKTLTLRQNATADFTAVGFMSTGDSASVAVSWSVTAGSIIDTSSNGKRHYDHYNYELYTDNINDGDISRPCGIYCNVRASV